MLRKGTAQNAKPSYTGDKLPKPTPIEWTGLQFYDRKRAKTTKNQFFFKLISSFDVCLSVHRCISVEKKTN